MTDPTTAEVRHLQAQVNVLMVGNRQITQSVAKQLDTVNRRQLEPMGRIRLGDAVLLIGRHRTDGTLVKAWPWHYNGGWWIETSPLPEPIIRCGGWYQDVSVTLNGEVLKLRFARTEPCTEGHGAGKTCAPWTMQQTGDAILDQVHQARMRIKADAALPLIVLAGLR